jgi:hypothetical protein
MTAVSPTAAAVARASASGNAARLNAGVLGHVLVWSGAAVAAVALFVLIGLDGWTYYTTPVAVRGYAKGHQLLRPSGGAGQLFGIAGFVLMLAPVAYAVRKKFRRVAALGSMKTWLEVHIFCGIVGPVFVTFHTSFKFNGIVAVAYWSMVVVVLSGFVGRYLFVRIPRTLSGIEMTRADVDARAAELSVELAEVGLPPTLLARVEEFEAGVEARSASSTSLIALFAGEFRVYRELAAVRLEIERAAAPELLHAVVDIIATRAMLRRNAAYLKKTKAFFDVWHVFHMPLVWVMFAIVVLHVAITVYMGYLPFAH